MYIVTATKLSCVAEITAVLPEFDDPNIDKNEALTGVLGITLLFLLWPRC